MTPQQTLWKRAWSTRPSGRNECLGRNLPNFTGLDKANCVLAVTHLAVSTAPALYLHRQRWALVVRTPILFPAILGYGFLPGSLTATQRHEYTPQHTHQSTQTYTLYQ